MKILHVLNELRASGAEGMLKNSSDYIREAGVELCVMSTGDEVGNYARVLEDSKFQVIHLPFKKKLSFHALISQAYKVSYGKSRFTGNPGESIIGKNEICKTFFLGHNSLSG